MMERRVRDNISGDAPDAEVFATLQAALELKPEIVPPADFARRVGMLAGTLPLSPKRGEIAYARITALVVALVVAIALFVLAPRTAADFRNLGFDMEMVVLLQLGLLAWWLSRQQNRSL